MYKRDFFKRLYIISVICMILDILKRSLSIERLDLWSLLISNNWPFSVKIIFHAGLL